jgi:hypothetical protein
MGILGHDVGCIPGPILLLEMPELILGPTLPWLDPPNPCLSAGKIPRNGGGVPAAVVVETISSVMVLKQEDSV